jgi:nicotinamide mononucleotide (NMN) deamidase PncC
MKTAMLLCLALIPGVAAAAGTSDKHDKKQDGLICRDIEETGSRLSSKRVCMTKEQWEDNRRQAREATDRAQTNQIPPKGY